VNTTDSAVRATHLPTGTSVVCTDQRSQFANKMRAKEILLEKLRTTDERAAKHQDSIGRTGGMSWGERVRSYVYTQVRSISY